MKRVSLLLFATLACLHVSAQISPVVPPSPEAATIGKYMDTPVNYHSGLPQVGIPLFQATSGDLSVPISLSYHLGGVKVEEVSSRVGLGWSLSAGGMITRSVRGIPDDLNNGFIKTDDTVAEFLAETPLQQLSLLETALEQQIDYEPDVFMVNCPGFSGKFIFSQQGEILFIENSEVKIEYVDSGWRGITEFKLTDTNGTIYHFGAYNGKVARDSTSYTANFEESQAGGGVPKNVSYPLYYNAWHLLAIESLRDNSKIELDYIFRLTESMGLSDQYFIAASDVECGVSEGTFTSYNSSETYEALIEKISFNQDSIMFHYDPVERDDKPGDNALIAVSHSNGIYYEFDQDYYVSFDSSSTVQPMPGFGTDILTHRLMLYGLKKWNADSTDVQEYSFEYNENFGMPNRLSYAQDMWGFYNGKLSNTKYIPQYFEATNGVPNPQDFIYYISGADRRSSEVYSKQLSLRKIVFPTGGYQLFNMEANGAYRGGIDTQLHNSFFELEDDLLVNYSYSNGQSQTFQQTFTVTEDHVDQVLHFDYEVFGCGGDPGEPGGISYCGLEVLVTGVNVTYSKTLSLNDDAYFKVPVGTFTLNITVVDNVPENEVVSSATATLKAFNNGSPYAERDEYAVGGLRIKDISFFNPGQLEPVLRKEYAYLTSDSLTSGFLSDQRWSFYIDTAGCVPIPYTAKIISSRSTLPFTGTGGSLVGYSEVREYVTTTGLNPGPDNGYTLYKYDYLYDAPNQYSIHYPLATPYRETPWRRGNLQEVKVYEYDAAIDTFLLKQKDETFYKHTTISDSLNPPYSYPIYREIDAIKVTSSATNLKWAGPYKILTGGNHVIETKKTVHDGTGQLITSKEFEFNKTFFRPDRTWEVNSIGDTIATEIYYPDDYGQIENLSPADTVVLSNMVSNNFVNVPILTKSKVNDITASKDLVYYDDTNGYFVPVSFTKWDRVNDIYFDNASVSYNGDNKPIEVLMIDGTVNSYLWGYGEVPVIKAVGVTYSELVNTLGPSTLSSIFNQQLSDQALRDLLLPLQTSYPNAQILIYTYKPGFGMSSVTDPNGRTTYYEYDSFGRLITVKDHDGNIQQKIEYNYKNN